MKSTTELPEGYSAIYSLDLQNDKKTALIVNGIAMIIGVVMVVAGHFIVPVTMLFTFDLNDGFGAYCLRMIILFVGVIVYMILHELVHGITMKCFVKTKIRYGYTGLYAFAGSDAYYAKRPYIIIALAPIVVWGIVLFVINLCVPAEWFWIVYFIQISNISGAAGDLYVSYKFRSFSDDILVRDTGISMTVYDKTE